MKRAFTLIELLVVIAIIAILAAILFPVFAQAKEAAKKTSSLTSIKQVATGLLLYSGDHDDLFPMASAPNSAAGTVRWNGIFDFPHDWRAASTSTLAQDFAMAWANSSLPYVKNTDIYAANGVSKIRRTTAVYAAAYPVALKPWKSLSWSMNGLLSSYSQTGIDSVSNLPLVWPMFGKGAFEGVAIANPALNCNGTGPCQFNASGPPQTGATAGSAWFWADNASYAMSGRNSAWLYGNGTLIARTDSSAKFIRIAGARDGVTWNNSAPNYTQDPFNRYDATGAPLSILNCNPNGAPVSYACYFRPDAVF